MFCFRLNRLFTGTKVTRYFVKKYENFVNETLTSVNDAYLAVK